jgi:HPt (histidine-containing phosphotransfer) domain-containing protein
MPSLDAAKVAELRQLDSDGRLMARLRDAFDRTAARQRADLLAAATAPQAAAPSVQRAAHTLHAAAVQLGATELAAHCGQLERSARDGALQDLPQRLAQLDSLLQQTQTALQTLCHD